MPLLLRDNRIFGFLAPKRHAAHLRGTLAADCGSCVAAETNPAIAFGLEKHPVTAILRADAQALPPDLVSFVLCCPAV